MTRDPLLGSFTPVKLECGICQRRITRAMPRIFQDGRYLCSDCSYRVERGELPPAHVKTEYEKKPSAARRLQVVAARDEAIERVREHTDPDWKRAAVNAVLQRSESHVDMIADDIWDIVGDTRENRSMGPVLTEAAARGYIESTDEFRPAHRIVNHGRPQRVWRSRLYRPPS